MEHWLSSCSLCDRSTEKRKTPPHPLQINDEDEGTLLRKQLEAFFLVNTLLHIPSDKCVGFLRSYGNPAEWIKTLCQGCQTKVEEAYELNEKIREFRKRIDSIGKDLALPLRVKRESIIGDNKNRGCVDEIRDFVCHRVSSDSTTIQLNKHGEEDKDDDDDYDLRFLTEVDEDDDGDPSWELSPQQSNAEEEEAEGDRVEMMDSSATMTLPSGTRSHGDKFSTAMTLAQIRDLSGPQLLSAIFDGTHTICPILGCGRMYAHLPDFRRHVKMCHSPFLLHLDLEAPYSSLPPDHECKEGLCLPSLLLNPSAFKNNPKPPKRKRKRPRPPSPIVHESLLSKEQILSMSADQLTQALLTEGSYRCPFCPHRTFPKVKSWKAHFERSHPKFLFHLKKCPTLHECEEGSCIPKPPTSSMPRPPPVKWVDIVTEQEEALGKVKEGEALSLEAQLFRKKPRRLAMLAQKHGVSSFPCQKCPLVCSTFAQWGDHQKSDHYDGYKCSQCGQKFSTPGNLENHSRAHHAERVWFICSGCNVHYKLFAEFNTHLQKNLDCKTGSLPCSKCKRRFETQESLALHKRIQHETDYGRPYVCPHCPETFCRRPRLKFHMETHTNKDGVICPQCGKTFANSGRLYSHSIRVHPPKGVSRHICGICKRGFQTNSDLRRHERLHGGDKPHLCPVCGKGFKIKNYLTIHSWSHDPEKRGKYAEYSQRLKNNEKRVKRGKYARVEEVAQ